MSGSNVVRTLAGLVEQILIGSHAPTRAQLHEAIHVIREAESEKYLHWSHRMWQQLEADMAKHDPSMAPLAPQQIGGIHERTS